MKLSVIIVNYNVKYFLEQALLSVRKASARMEVEVFVVDNNSVDDSVPMVREKFPEVRLIANKDNPGFSRANNQAIRESRGEYVLLLNPDTVVEEDTFQKCAAFMDAHPRAGALGVRMIDGSGAFLPESKRGFPSPFVAFCKMSGLSRLFSQSPVFNRYHLGYLDPNDNHPVEVLAGAFMWLRRSVLDEVGLLDETFFMYGEDIDLSYRIVQGGYQNYYFADTTIIHYKGESTKKGSLNYVRAFYNAMIIFARKHFHGDQARFYILILQVAIYVRAALTLLNNGLRRLFLPLLEAGALFAGMYFLKDFWANYYFQDPNYYQTTFVYFNIPLYISIWLGAVYFSGGYDEPGNIRKLIRGLLLGTLLLAAVYGFLDLAYRSSRLLIVLGAVWAILATTGIRLVRHFIRHGNFRLGLERDRNLVIVGTEAEGTRVRRLIWQAQVSKNFIGIVAPEGMDDPETYLSSLEALDEVVQIYKVDEIIFCASDIRSQDIMRWMTRLGPDLEYKIVPQESESIIGSSSKNSAGELYTIDIRFQIGSYLARRNKRVLDLLLSLGFLLLSPFLLFFVRAKAGLLRNILRVLLGKKTWVGYRQGAGELHHLPPLRPGVLTPLDGLHFPIINNPTIQRLNFLYAKDYTAASDLDIIWRGWSNLGR
ncbi:MAG: glycosyltransferase [Bacteroidota bacterium]